MGKIDVETSVHKGGGNFIIGQRFKAPAAAENNDCWSSCLLISGKAVHRNYVCAYVDVECFATISLCCAGNQESQRNQWPCFHYRSASTIGFSTNLKHRRAMRKRGCCLRCGYRRSRQEGRQNSFFVFPRWCEARPRKRPQVRCSCGDREVWWSACGSNLWLSKLIQRAAKPIHIPRVSL